MTKKKESNQETITGCGRSSNKLTVQKANPLTALWASEFTLPEFKILDTYLARIDSHNPESRSVRFEKGELEKLLGVKKINISDLKVRVMHLMRPIITEEDTNELCGITLFEEARCKADDNGIWQLTLTCTTTAMMYFFNIEQIGYYRYKLRCVANISSRYSYILFQYLEQNRYRNSWEIELGELKRILNCDKQPTYEQFKDFNKLLLKHCWQEITEKTECKFTYIPIKRGRNIVAVQFTLEKLPKLQDEQGSVFERLDEADLRHKTFDPNGTLSFLHDAVQGEFTDVEFEQIFAILTHVKDSKLAKYGIPIHDENGIPDIDFQRYAYLDERYKAMLVADSRHRINNRYNYFIKILKKDAELDE